MQGPALICSTLTLLLAAGSLLRSQESALPKASEAAKARPGTAKEKKVRKDPAFKLGEVTVEVTGQMEPVEQVNSRLEMEEIRAFSRDTVPSALTLVPGVTFTVNSRNEQMLYVRGMDSRQVPVYLDGIPVYVPYDGNVDFGRFTTFDLAGIQVAKGFSSVLYGANTLGGAINLVSRRPTKVFEGDAVLGAFDGGKKAALNIGSRQDLWYVQAGGSYLDAGDWRMSSRFLPNALEDGGRRINSDTTDRKGSIKLGFTPNANDEYVLGYVNQKGERGQPVTADPRVSVKYWRWPQWDKESAFFSSHTSIGSAAYLRLRAYHDAYQNTLEAYTDANYTTLATTGGMAPTGRSLYDDFTNGAMAEGGISFGPHSVKAVVQTRTDVHREGDGLNAWRHYKDSYLCAGAEGAFALSRSLDLSLGLGYDRLKPEEQAPRTDISLPAPKNCTHGQAGLFWKATPSLQVYGTLSQKDRFPTLKDRYSTKFGSFLDNPLLRPERSTSYEVGGKAQITGWLSAEGALFRSDIRDLIQGVPLPGNLTQMQNIGKVRHTGAELSLAFKPSDLFQAGLGYTYLDRSNESAPAVKLTGTPRNHLTGYLRAQPIPSLHFLASVETQSYLWDSISTRTTTISEKVGGFTTAQLSAGWEAGHGLSLEGGFRNLLDRNYALSLGFPMPGRTWYADLRYRF